MAALKNPRHEQFAQFVAKGLPGSHAYVKAGFSPKGAAASANRLLKDAKIEARVSELLTRRDAVEENGIKIAIQKTGITKARVLEELAKLGFSNMLDYMRVGVDGDPVLDFSAISRDQAAALIEVTVEDFKDGRGEESRDVRRVKFKLGDKRAALVDIGKELGMFVDRKEIRTGPLEEKSDDELDRIIRQYAAEAEISIGASGEGPATKH